ncbi:MAG: ABC transporter permease [Lactobacillaceae bacterium]|jgi:putative ABC transport system permease protein|nr:ABC transporter permease [Lactobacillaceae bacterium]
MFDLLLSSTSQGLLWATIGIGLFITFRILNITDMTVEGSYPLGAAVSVSMIHAGLNPVVSILIAIFSGMIAGLVTGMLTTIGKIPSLLAGILTMTGLYSVNLLVMGNKANLSLLGYKTIFNSDLLRFIPQNFRALFIGILIVTVLIALMFWFLNTQLGQAFIATGDNPIMAESIGIDTRKMSILGLVISNAIVATGGAVIAQSDGYADVNKGIGTIVVALASIVIAEVIYNDQLTLGQRLITIVLGSIIYRIVILIVLSIGLDANLMKLISAVLLAAALIFPNIRKRSLIKK